MLEFTSYDETDAPAGARPTLETAKKEMGQIPNIYRYMADSPELLEGYRYLRGLLGQTSFSAVEQELVLLTINFEHGCNYCMAGHSFRAKKVGMDDAVLEALRAGKPVPDAKLEALHAFTIRMVAERAWVGDAAVQAFLDAGYSRRNIMEIVLAISTKVLTNYSNHFFDAPLNDFLEPFAWSKPKALSD